MPLFFFFSGFFFVVGKYAFKKFVKRRLRTLYVPFVIWSLLFLFLHNVLVTNGVCEGEEYDLHRLAQNARKIFVEMKQYETLGGTFWFFTQLLVVNVIGFAYLSLVEKATHGLKQWHKCVLAALPLLLATTMAAYGVTFYVGQVSYITLLGLFFFVCGYYLHGLSVIGRKPFLVALTVIVLSGWTNREMIRLDCNEIIPYAVVAICGIILIYNVSSVLTTAKYVGVALDYIGRHTLSIMILHFSAFKIVSCLLVSIGSMPLSRLSDFPVIGDAPWPWLVCYMVVGVMMPLGLNEIYLRMKQKIHK